MQTAPSASATAINQWIRDYSSRFLNVRLYDERKTLPPHLVLEFGNRGLFGLQVPRSHDGLGMSTADTLTVLEQLGALDLTVATLVVNNDFLGVRPFERFATPAQRDAVLPDFARGRRLISYALSEPHAGSNPQSIRARAEAKGEGRWSISAEKKWIGNVAWASYVNVFAKTRDAEGHEAITGFSVPMESPGIQLTGELPTMGMRAMIQSRVVFEDVAASEKHVLGRVGAGAVVTNDAMMHTRLAFGAAFLGAMKRVLQIATRYATRREGLTTGSLLRTPLTRARLWTSICRVRGLEELLLYASEAIETEQTAPQDLLTVVKIVSAEYLWKTVDDCLQLLGGRGYLENNDLPRFLRDARVSRIYEGPTETLAHYLGMRALRASPALQDLFVSKLDAADRLRELSRFFEELRARASSERHLEPPESEQWAAYRAGVATAKELVAAIVRRRGRASTDRALTAMASFWEDELSAAQRGALAPDLVEYVPHPDNILEAVASYEARIGLLVSASFEEELLVDPMLRPFLQQATHSTP